MALAERAGYLDRRVNTLTSVGVTTAYSGATNITLWTLPYSVDLSGCDGALVAVLEDGTVLSTTRPAANQIAAVGNYTVTAVLIGVLYPTTYRLSRIYLRNLQTDAPETRGRMQLRFLTLLYDHSTDFTVTVTTDDGRSSIYTFSSTTAQSGRFLVPIQARNLSATVTITCSLPGACNFVGYEWEGQYHVRDRLQ